MYKLGLDKKPETKAMEIDFTDLTAELFAISFAHKAKIFDEIRKDIKDIDIGAIYCSRTGERIGYISDEEKARILELNGNDPDALIVSVLLAARPSSTLIQIEEKKIQNKVNPYHAMSFLFFNGMKTGKNSVEKIAEIMREQIKFVEFIKTNKIIDFDFIKNGAKVNGKREIKDNDIEEFYKNPAKKLKKMAEEFGETLIKEKKFLSAREYESKVLKQIAEKKQQYLDKLAAMTKEERASLKIDLKPVRRRITLTPQTPVFFTLKRKGN